MTPDELKALVRSVPDFPAPGVLFRDITTLIGHGPGLRAAVGHLAERAGRAGAEAIAGMEARGFIFGAAVAIELGVGFIPVRKPGKLPVPTIGVDYALEYGHDRLEIDPGAIGSGQRVAIVDDLIATGGTAVAATELLRQAGGGRTSPVRDRSARPGWGRAVAVGRTGGRRADELSRALTSAATAWQAALRRAGIA